MNSLVSKSVVVAAFAVTIAVFTLATCAPPAQASSYLIRSFSESTTAFHGIAVHGPMFSNSSHPMPSVFPLSKWAQGGSIMETRGAGLLGPDTLSIGGNVQHVMAPHGEPAGPNFGYAKTFSGSGGKWQTSTFGKVLVHPGPFAPAHRDAYAGNITVLSSKKFNKILGYTLVLGGVHVGVAPKPSSVGGASLMSPMCCTDEQAEAGLARFGSASFAVAPQELPTDPQLLTVSFGLNALMPGNVAQVSLRNGSPTGPVTMLLNPTFGEAEGGGGMSAIASDVHLSAEHFALLQSGSLYLNVSTTDGDNISGNLRSIPEPASCAMLLCGAVVVAMGRRRGRRFAPRVVRETAT